MKTAEEYINQFVNKYGLRLEDIIEEAQKQIKMNTEKLFDLISNSELPNIQKSALKGFVLRSQDNEEEENKDRLLIGQVANENKLSRIILSTDEVKIYTISGNDEWDIKYPYRIIYLDSNKTWKRNNTLCSDLDTAYLSYLGTKYLGLNTQFVDFAMKMLEIPNDMQCSCVLTSVSNKIAYNYLIRNYRIMAKTKKNPTRKDDIYINYNIKDVMINGKKKKELLESRGYRLMKIIRLGPSEFKMLYQLN